MGKVNALGIAADHPACAGHFPGAPLLPGVVLLDAVLRQIALGTTIPAHQWRMAVAKFHTPVSPGTALWLEHAALPDGSVRFTISASVTPRPDARIVASGVLLPRPALQTSAT